MHYLPDYKAEGDRDKGAKILSSSTMNLLSISRERHRYGDPGAADFVSRMKEQTYINLTKNI